MQEIGVGSTAGGTFDACSNHSMSSAAIFLKDSPMTLADYSVTAFTVLNGARLLAYLPQIICVHRDRSGASSVSMMTWVMFFSANMATVFYALAVIGDRIMATVFAANAAACVAIFVLILRKRILHARRDSRTERRFLSVFSLRRIGVAAWPFHLPRRLEDRIAFHYAADKWSDRIEREINREWMDHHCGRRHCEGEQSSLWSCQTSARLRP
jgi:hypothetical protein